MSDSTAPYSSCTAITPDGKVMRNRSVRTPKLMTVDQALEALRSGRLAEEHARLGALLGGGEPRIEVQTPDLLGVVVLLPAQA